MTDWLYDIEQAATVMAIAFAIAALLCSMIWIFWPRAHLSSVKLLGSLMVLAMSFASNHWAVYALAIFIVATLVTELDFLEKLAALFWNRDKYWDYRASKATPAEVQARLREEALKELATEASENGPRIEKAAAATVAAPPSGQPSAEPRADTADTGELPTDVETPAFSQSAAPPGEPHKRPRTASQGSAELSTRVNQLIHDLSQFEREVQAALRSASSPFVAADRITTGLTITRRNGQHVEFDAVVETPNADFVIEIRHSFKATSAADVALRLLRACATYRHYIQSHHPARAVVPVIIVSADEPRPTAENGVLIVGFDMRTKSLVGAEGLRVIAGAP